MAESKQFGSFTMDIDGRTWSVDVSREAVEDRLRVQSLSDDDLDAWVDDNAVALSDIAQDKIGRGDCGPDWVQIKTLDVNPQG